MDFADTRAGLTDFATRVIRTLEERGRTFARLTFRVGRFQVHVRFASMMKHVVAVRNSGRITAPVNYTNVKTTNVNQILKKIKHIYDISRDAAKGWKIGQFNRTCDMITTDSGITWRRLYTHPSKDLVYSWSPIIPTKKEALRGGRCLVLYQNMKDGTLTWDDPVRDKACPPLDITWMIEQGISHKVTKESSFEEVAAAYVAHSEWQIVSEGSSLAELVKIAH